MAVSIFVKISFGAVVALACFGAIAGASKPVAIHKNPDLTPTVNPATEDRTATWIDGAIRS